MKSEEQIVSEIADAIGRRHESEKQKYCARRRVAGEGNPELNIDGLWIRNGKGDSGWFISFEHTAYRRTLPVCLRFEFRNTTVVVNGIAFSRNADLTSALEVLWNYFCKAVWEGYELREFIVHPSFFEGSEVVTA